jgi:hypothetical protein
MVLLKNELCLMGQSVRCVFVKSLRRLVFKMLSPCAASLLFKVHSLLCRKGKSRPRWGISMKPHNNVDFITCQRRGRLYDFEYCTTSQDCATAHCLALYDSTIGHAKLIITSKSLVFIRENVRRVRYPCAACRHPCFYLDMSGNLIDKRE